MGVMIEFWMDEKSLSPAMRKRAMDEAGLLDESLLKNAIVIAVPNGVAKVLSSDSQEKTNITVADKEYTTYKFFTENILSKVQFPIDVVYTWVDDLDPEWRERYEAAKQRRRTQTARITHQQGMRITKSYDIH